MQDLKFKQDVEQAEIAWNQFTVCTCTRQKQECQQKFFVISILTFYSQNYKIAVSRIRVREKNKTSSPTEELLLPVTLFQIYCHKMAMWATLTNFHFLYFRSDTFKTRTKESK